MLTALWGEPECVFLKHEKYWNNLRRSVTEEGIVYALVQLHVISGMFWVNVIISLL